MLEAQTKRMSNLTTVLALLFPTEFTLLTFLPPLLPSSAIQDLDVEASNWAAAAVIAASIAIGATMVGLVGAVFFQMLAGQVRKGHATDFLTLSKPVAWLSFFAVIGVGVSCLSITISLACSVWVRYDNHSSPSAVVDANHSSAVVAANHLSALTVVAANHSSVVVAANHSSAVVAANHVVACILIVAVFLCIAATRMYFKIQSDCSKDMHLIEGFNLIRGNGQGMFQRRYFELEDIAPDGHAVWEEHRGGGGEGGGAGDGGGDGGGGEGRRRAGRRRAGRRAGWAAAARAAAMASQTVKR